ncbi:MAG: pantetheine-phosphate adenylyltransferase [Gammaproteobacteria bacterium]|nr:pantetheine-phosphate adenylyltransferase [Gammaproteobacteria bacterium]
MSHNAIYPGSFDPITYGHIDLIERASKLFEHIIVTVAENGRKKCLFSAAERLDMITTVTQRFANVSVMAFDGLLVDFAKSQQCEVIIRGIRTISDFDFEFQMAGMNRHLTPEIETLFMITNNRYHALSSSLLKEIAARGKTLEQFVPPEIERALFNKLTAGA